MTRASIGDWASGLPPGPYARAIAALGILPRPQEDGRDEATYRDPQALADLLLRTWERQPARLRWSSAVWYEPKRWAKLKAIFRPDVAAEAWARFRRGVRARASGGPPTPLRLLVVAQYMNDRAAADTLGWLNRTLMDPEVGLESLFLEWWLNSIASGDVRERQAWHWPLRVGILPDERSRSLKQAIEAAPPWFYDDLVRFYVLAAGTETCDLLLSPHDPEATRGGIERGRVRASAVVLLDHPPPDGSEAAFVELLRLHRACGVSVLGLVPPGAPALDYVREMLFEVTHDRPLDAALHAAAVRLSPGSPPLVLATGEFIDETRVSAITPRLAARLAGRGLQAEASAVLAAAARLAFDLETMGASEIRRQQAQHEEALRRPVPRYIQAQVRHWRPEGRRFGPRAAAFRPGAWHAVGVHIGPAAARERPVVAPFPDERIPWTANRAEELTIVLAAPGCEVQAVTSSLPPDPFGDGGPGDPLLFDLLVLRDGEAPRPGREDGAAAEAAQARVAVRSSGPSDSALFLLRPGEAACGQVVARIMVLHSNRILQTAILEGPLVAKEDMATEAAGEGTPPATPIVPQPEGVVRMSLDDLDDRQSFDLAILVNRLAGRPSVTLAADWQVTLRPFDEGRIAAGRIRDTLQAVIDHPHDFAGEGSEALREMLLRLAFEGVPLRDSLLRDFGLGRTVTERTQRIQIVSAHPEAFLPLEFLYDGDAPEAAATPLCPNRAAALRDGSCGGCPDRHSGRVVCPMRFWGLGRIIERHAFDGETAPEADIVRTSAALPLDKRFPMPAAAVIAHSHRARRFKDGQAAIQAVQDAVIRVVTRTLPCDDWKAWRQQVGQCDPALLLLLPHSDRDPLLGEVLEIGETSYLGAAQINAAVIGKAERVMAILLGCDTADQAIRYVSFTTRFRHAGAEIVVGTLTPVLGRHAAPVARMLIEELAAVWSAGGDGATLGEAIARTRRHFMLRGLPVGLSLVAYGDADWVLA